MNIFTTREIIEAVKGTIIFGRPNDCFSGVSIDSRTVKNGDIFICIKGERFDGHDFIPEAIRKGARCVIFDKDTVVLLGSKIPHNLIAVDNTLTALTDLAYYHRKRFALPIIGITGSNGKTTTKEMAAHLLSAKYTVLKNEGTQNNIIGVSLNLLRLRAEHTIAVFELGTNHFGEILELTRILAPSVGVITNIGPAHLESFKDETGVLREKWNLIEELAAPRIAIINSDDPLLKEKIPTDEQDIRCFTFGIHSKADFMAKGIVGKNKKVSFYIKNYPILLPTASKINVYNALASYALARIFSIDGYDIIKNFREFSFPYSRFQMKQARGINFIDDAYNANPVSLHFAVDAFSNLGVRGKKIVVLADMLELGKAGESFHRKAGELLSRSSIDMIIGVGPLSRLACETAAAFGFNAHSIYSCSSSQEAKNIIFDVAKKDDCILLKGSRAMKLEEIFKGHT